MNIQQTLKNLGLSDQEVKIYLAALELGPASVQKVSTTANIKRPTTYLIYNSLEKKGFMGSFVDRSGIKLVAEDPEKLLAIAKKRHEDLNNVIPQLQALQATKTSKPQITYYTGKEAYYTIAEDSLQLKNSTIYMLGSFKDIHSIITEKYDLEYYIPKRIEQNLKVKAITPEKCIPAKMLMADEKQLRQTKFLPIEFYTPTFEIIYGNKVAFFSSEKELFGVIIKSKEFAETEKKKFMFMWSKL